MTILDFEHGTWVLIAPALKGAFHFHTLTRARAFAAEHSIIFKMTNRAVVRSIRRG